MNTKIDLIISIIMICLIIIYKIYQLKRYKLKSNSNMYKLSNKLCISLLILSIIIFIINIIYYYIIKSLNISNVLFSLSMMICILPINLFNMYRMYFDDEEKYSHIKTIITRTIPSKKLIANYIKAGINIVVLSKDKPEYKIKKLDIKDINKTNLKRTCIINSDDINIVKKYLIKDEVIFSNQVSGLYKKIYNSRGIHDNYIRNIKYILCLYLSIFLSSIVFIFGNFPLCMNLSIILIFKLFSLLCSEFIFKDLKYDVDIMDRKVKDKNVFIGKQELLILFIMSILILIAVSLPYMFMLASSSNMAIVRGVYYVIILYCMLFFNYYNYSEKVYIINIINSFKSIRLIVYLLLTIVLSLILSLWKVFYVDQMSIRNYFASVLVAFIICLLFDTFKFSRWMSNRRK